MLLFFIHKVLFDIKFYDLYFKKNTLAPFHWTVELHAIDDGVFFLCDQNDDFKKSLIILIANSATQSKIDEVRLGFGKPGNSHFALLYGGRGSSVDSW